MKSISEIHREVTLTGELPRELTVRERLDIFRRVRERDGNRCVLCWSKTNLHVHHFWDSADKPILPPNSGHVTRNPYLDTQTYDLVTLCQVCHGKMHSSDWRSPLMGLLREIIRKLYTGIDGVCYGCIWWSYDAKECRNPDRMPNQVWLKKDGKCQK